jgi:hypothetical protein
MRNRLALSGIWSKSSERRDAKESLKRRNEQRDRTAYLAFATPVEGRLGDFAEFCDAGFGGGLQAPQDRRNDAAGHDSKLAKIKPVSR